MTNKSLYLALVASLTLTLAAEAAAPPVVSNVRASQRTGTKLVDIYYDLSDPDSSAVNVFVYVLSLIHI